MPQTRPEWNDHRFYYKVILDIAGLKHGLFVEFRLVDDAPAVPTVQIVHAHPQRP